AGLNASPTMQLLRIEPDLRSKLDLLKQILAGLPAADGFDNQLIATLVPEIDDDIKALVDKYVLIHCGGNEMKTFVFEQGKANWKTSKSSVTLAELRQLQPIMDAYRIRGWKPELESFYSRVRDNGDLECQIEVLKFDIAAGLAVAADQQSKLIADRIHGRPQATQADLKVSLQLLDKCMPASHHGRMSNGQRLLLTLKDRLSQQLMKRQCLDVSEQLDSTGLKLETSHEYAMAEKMYRESLSILEKNLIPGDPLIADSLCNVARVCGKQGRMPMATDLFQKALKIYRAHAPGSNDQIIAALTAYGEALEEAHQKVSANVLYDQARDLMRQKAAKGL
ncbi:MAG TPA: tetratricopeptide repeat protein, partial [Chroococcales cyanobacterium]